MPLLIAALTAIIAAAWSWRREFRVRHWPEVEGDVLDFTEVRRRKGGAVYHATVRYRLVDRWFEAHVLALSKPAARLVLLYDPRKPAYAISAEARRQFGWSRVLGSFGALLFVFSLTCR